MGGGVRGGIRATTTSHWLLLASLLCGSSAFAQVKLFDIPSEEATKSIPEFARQADVQIMGPGALLRSVITPEVKGAYDIDAALQMMLKGTDLKIGRTAEGILMISPPTQESACIDRGEAMTSKTKLTTTVSWMAMLIASLQCALAQNEGQQLETVVVTGQRASIISAIEQKKAADIVVDTVAAEDIGRLPDNSITEVLQRVPGVNITRIQTGGSSESYMGEGTGISIRGLDSVVSQLNGRDAFSSANGRNLAWEDIPPELAQGVDVYKSLSAGLPEGGFGGVVNLRTRQPFDFDGFALNLTATGNYADYASKGHVGGVGLISDRWNTSIGEFGLLVNVAYSDLTTKADGVQLSPYMPVVWSQGYPSNQGLPYVSSYSLTSDSNTPVTCSGNSSYQCREVYVPSAIDFNQRYDDRVRVGYYAAAQWKLNDRLQLFATGFRSRYTDNSRFHYIIVDGSGHTVLSPDSTNTFDANGNLLSSNGFSNYMYADPSIGSSLGVNPGWAYQPIPYQFETSYDHSINETTDFSFGGEWNPTDPINVKFALQHIESFARDTWKSAYLYAFLPGYGLTLSPYGSSSIPSLSLPDVDLTNPNRFGWLATMDHDMNNVGRENAAYIDVLWNISDKGFFRALRFGLKLTDRKELDHETSWNYQNLTPWFGSGLTRIDAGHAGEECFTVQYGVCAYQSYASEGALKTAGDTNRAYSELFDTGAFFNGKSGLPAKAFFPSMTLLNSDFSAIHSYKTGLGGPGDQTQAAAFQPTDLSKLTETSETFYAQADFADEDWIVPFSGNIGVRVVAYKDHATGYFKLPFFTQPTQFYPVAQWIDCNNTSNAYYGNCLIRVPGSSNPNSIAFTAPQSAQLIEGGHSEVVALPSLNIQFQPIEELKIRLAASQGISRPSFQQLNPKGQAYGNYVGTYTSFFNGNIGNADLKPEKAEQFDASIEYYFKSGGLFHFSPFYKRIHNYISNEPDVISITVPTVIAGGTAIPTSDPIGHGDQGCTPPLAIGQACPQTFAGVVMIKPFNEHQVATVEGFEVGLQKYADFLPDPFDGFGVDFNYTYIDSSQPGALAYDMKGNRINDLPLVGLSKNTINAALMYDKQPLSLRLAYNWRDDFLVSTAAYQTTGNYNYIGNLSSAGGLPQGAIVRYSLPVFQYPFGTLDANMTYTLTDNVTWSIEASNLTKEIARLYMGVGNRRENRSWYTADTRYTTQIRVKF
jgi:TonB-dependent receptor